MSFRHYISLGAFVMYCVTQFLFKQGIKLYIASKTTCRLNNHLGNRSSGWTQFWWDNYNTFIFVELTEEKKFGSWWDSGLLGFLMGFKLFAKEIQQFQGDGHHSTWAHELALKEINISSRASLKIWKTKSQRMKPPVE